MTSKILPESSVLTPRDPSITNADDWPEFRLSDASVKLPERTSNQPVSLLLASEHHPLTVTGTLEQVPKELAHTYLLPVKQKTPTIEVAGVRSFAYGAYEDGGIDIWAAGQAGWFVISPSKKYQRIYNGMVEGVNVLFFISDAYKTTRKTGKGRNATELPDYSPKELFEKYAEEVMKGKGGPAVAAERIYKHRDFLISSMVAGKEGLAWSRNPLYNHMYKKFPDDFARIKQRLAGPSPAEIETQHEPMGTRGRQPSTDTASTTSSLKRKRGRPPKNATADTISIESNSVADCAVKDDAKNLAAKTKENSQPNRTAPLPTRRRGQRSQTLTPATGTQTPEIQELQPEPPAQESDTDSIPRRAHKGTSALRLKPNKPSKGPPKSSKARQTTVDEEEDEEPDPTPAPVGKRNKYAQRSTRSTKHEIDEGIDMPTSPSSSAASPTSDDAVTGALDPSLPLRLNHQPDPIQEDTYLCALDGCTHKVYAASLPESQNLIREHYALHAYDDDERVQLVKRLQAPSLPVGHLMNKVRTQAKLEGFPGSKVAGSRFPEPVRTRY